MSEPSRRDSSVSSSDRRHSNVGIYIIGILLVLFVILIAVLGSRSAIDSINRNANEQLVATQQSIRESVEASANEKIAAAQEAQATAEEALKAEQERFTTDQIEWARENRIHWNEDGNPENENGEVVDDPTTDVDEVARAKKLEEPEEEETEEETEENNEDWWKDNPAITQDEDGNLIHIVARGETLSDIAAATGFTTQELAEYNNLSNPSLIVTNQVLKIPPEGPELTETGVTADKIGLG